MSLDHAKKATKAEGAPATNAPPKKPLSVEGLSRETLQKTWKGEDFADGGTLYAETDFARPIVEPLNAFSALAFAYVAVSNP